MAITENEITEMALDYLERKKLIKDVSLKNGFFTNGYIKDNLCSTYLSKNKKDILVNVSKDDNYLSMKNEFININMNSNITGKRCQDANCIFKTCPYLMYLKNKMGDTTQEVEEDNDLEERLNKIRDEKLKSSLTSLKNLINYSFKNNIDLLFNQIILDGENDDLKTEVLKIIALMYGEKTYTEVDLTKLQTIEDLRFLSKIAYLINYERLVETNRNYEFILNKIFEINDKSLIVIDNNKELKITNKSFEIVVPDYNEDELIEKLLLDISNKNLVIDETSKNHIKNGYIKEYMREYPSLKNLDLVNAIVLDIIKVLSNKNSIYITIDCLRTFNKSEENIEIVKKKLNNLVGLSSVKKQLDELMNYLIFINKTKDKINVPTLNLHSVFLGNPGTGKTTIARLYANMLYDLGYLKENKLTEVAREDLIAEYVGQTSVKTKKVFDGAMGGVLFIDEAYSLTPKGGNGFEAECISTIIKIMEDRRDDIVVIFAGYEDDMEKFLDANEGLRSRVTNKIFFEDYSVEELYLIFKNSLSAINMNLDESCKYKVMNIISDAKNDKSFGNGRFIMNLRQKVLMKHAINTNGVTDEETLLTINKNDFD